jgi:hypothetical protein
MIKNFSELLKVEIPITKKPIFKYDKVKQKTVQDGELDTISWVDTLRCLYENGAEKVTYENVINPKTGGLLFNDDNGCMHICVYVDVDGDRREIFYPLIDGTKVVPADKVTQSDIYNAKQRAFVKCVALNWGLGITVWKKSDAEEQAEKKEPEKTSKVFRDLVNAKAKSFGSVAKMLEFVEDKSGKAINEKKIKELIESLALVDDIMFALSLS